MKKIKWIILTTVAVLLLVSPCVNAEDVSDNKESLRGIKSMWVRVGRLPRKAKEIGFNRDKIRTEVESKIQTAGIKVVHREESRAIPNIPCLYVKMLLSEGKSNLAYAVVVEVREEVYLTRDPNLKRSATPWWRIIIGEHTGGKGVENEITDTLKILLDEFLRDHLSVNPRQPSTPQKGR